MKTLTIQPNGSKNPAARLPYPWHIDESGKVLKQDFWKGDPAELIGFAPAYDHYEIAVELKEVLEKGVEVIRDLLPIFATSAGDWATFTSISGYTYTINERDVK